MSFLYSKPSNGSHHNWKSGQSQCDFPRGSVDLPAPHRSVLPHPLVGTRTLLPAASETCPGQQSSPLGGCTPAMGSSQRGLLTTHFS